MVEYEKDLLQNSLNKKMLREYEKDQYHNKLLENIDKLMDIGIEIGDDGKYYFYNFEGNSQQPKIVEKNLTSFPDAGVLQQYGIIKKLKIGIANGKQLAKLFHVL